MNYFESEYFTYKNDKLFCENLNLGEISSEIGTPTFIYSKKFFMDSYKSFNNSFKEISHKIFYATKANYNINVIRLFNQLGAGIDVNSAGEFYRASAAGVSPKEMIMSGVGKTDEEIQLALENEILLLKAESIQEINRINEIAKSLNKIAPLAIRVNPNVDPATHPYISTGLAENKFGIDETLAIKIFIEVSKLSNVKLLGIDMHIGSQITTIQPYIDAVKKIINLVNSLKEFGINIKHIDIGGGYGVKYNDENLFSIDDLANEIVPILKQTDCEIFFEPGRALTANGGILLSKVLYTKTNLDKNFIVVDSAMTDLLRPSIYKAYHHIQPIEIKNNEDIIADVVGPVCESGDFLAKNRNISKCDKNDLIAVMSCGAYGMVMSSNYNARRRAAEVLVDDDKFFVIRERETFEQMWQNEKLI
ncbi:MAG: diaminopimelate decarboxylase [Ignavibacteriae bacterium]|nr:diaminopimelate decarboxylase [Ignavibacteriota bacterium]